MRRLNRIPLRTEGAVAPAVFAILHEVKGALERYAATGEPTVIDLGWLAALPAHLEQLRAVLGGGEVSATVHALGVSRVRETGVPCVGWVSHRDGAGGVLTEMLDIGQTPALLCGDAPALGDGIAELRGRLAALRGCGA